MLHRGCGGPGRRPPCSPWIVLISVHTGFSHQSPLDDRTLGALHLLLLCSHPGSVSAAACLESGSVPAALPPRTTDFCPRRARGPAMWPFCAWLGAEQASPLHGPLCSPRMSFPTLSSSRWRRLPCPPVCACLRAGGASPLLVPSARVGVTAASQLASRACQKWVGGRPGDGNGGPCVPRGSSSSSRCPGSALEGTAGWALSGGRTGWCCPPGSRGSCWFHLCAWTWCADSWGQQEAGLLAGSASWLVSPRELAPGRALV